MMRRNRLGGFVIATLAGAGCTAFALASLPLSPEEEEAILKQWAKQADVVLCGHVTSVSPRFRLGRFVGDWVYLLTGSRFGISDRVDALLVRVSQIQVIKGEPPINPTLTYEMPQVESPGWLFGRDRLQEGHLYVFFCDASPGRLRVIHYEDVRRRPEIVKEVRRVAS